MFVFVRRRGRTVMMKDIGVISAAMAARGGCPLTKRKKK